MPMEHLTAGNRRIRKGNDDDIAAGRADGRTRQEKKSAPQWQRTSPPRDAGPTLPGNKAPRASFATAARIDSRGHDQVDRLIATDYPQIGGDADPLALFDPAQASTPAELDPADDF